MTQNVDPEGPDDEGKDWFQILAIMSMGISFCSAGAMFAWTSPSIPILISDDFHIEITLEEASYLTVIPPLGQAIGSFLFTAVMDRIGRKYAMLLIAVPQASVWIIVMFSKSINLFYLSRLVSGLADGGVYTILPTYMSEVTTPSVRGSWGNVSTTAICFGFFLINAVGGVFNIKVTAYLFIVLPVLYFFAVCLLPESPYYLIMHNKENEARKALQILRRKKNVEVELTQLMLAVQRQLREPGSWKALFMTPTHRKALFAGTFVRAAQQFSGISAFASSTAHFFQEAGADFSVTVSAMMFTILLTIMNIFSSAILDRMGRRIAMTVSSGGCAFILLSVAIYFYVDSNTDVNVSPIKWFPVAGMFLFICVFCIGLGPVPNLVIGEVFSTSIKAKGVCVLNVTYAIYVSSSTKLFHHLSQSHGMYSIFLLFGCSCVVATIFSYYIVPEIKGKTLDEIQMAIRKSIKSG